MAIRVGVNILQSLFSLQLPLTRKPYNKVRDIFFKEVFAHLLFIASVCIQHIMYVEKGKILYFGLARNLIRHLISPDQDDLSYSARTFISGHRIL